MLCEGKVVCNFLELGQFGSPNSKGVSKGRAWGLFGGEHSLKVARSARAVQGFPLDAKLASSSVGFRGSTRHGARTVHILELLHEPVPLI